MTWYAVSLMNASLSPYMILTCTAYVNLSSTSVGSYSISKAMGTCPGFSITYSPMVTDGASARDTSLSLTSTTASGERAIRSR